MSDKNSPLPSAQVLQQFQFDLKSLFWLTVTVSLALAFLRPMGRGVVLQGLLVTGVAGATGLLIGLLCKRVGDVVYWSILAAVFAFISVVHVSFAQAGTRYAWVAVGILTGCAIGSVAEERRLQPIVLGSATGLATMGVYAAVLHGSGKGAIMFDLICAPVIGGLLGGLAVILRWLHRAAGLRQDVTATFLMASVVIGNALARYLLPGTLVLALLLSASGCGGKLPREDPAPFEAAVERYLEQNGMALKIKAIRDGPTVTDTGATMTASMTHAELGGPSVVWGFEFERTASGDWRVVRHQVE